MFWKHLQAASSEEAARLQNDPSVLQLPVASVFMASISSLLSEDLGMRRSAETGESRLGNGAAVPMISFSLIEYLDGLDLSGFDLLEIGGGLSTDFWVARAKSVHTLETNKEWLQAIAARNPRAKVELIQEPLGPKIASLPQTYDAIIIDPAGNRLACARAAIGKLKPGGFIMLDNSEWYPNASRALRDAGLIEVDFHDFRPCHYYRTTTSIYLHKDFRPKPKVDKLPRVPIGGKHPQVNYWDMDPEAA